MLIYQKWINKKITRDFTGKLILITGGNSGIGFEATRHFVALGAKIVWGCRSLERAEKAKKLITDEFENADIKIMKLDLSDFCSIETFLDQVKTEKIEFDIIYNNAGVFRIPRGKTAQNYELVMGTNLVGTYYLTELLLKHFGDTKRPLEIMLTGSIISYFGNINYKDPFMEKHRYRKMKIYAYSKRGIHQYFDYLLKNNKNENIKFYLVHPGITYTPLINKAYKSKFFLWLATGFMKIFFHTAEKASLTAVFAANSMQNGVYVGPRGLFSISGYPNMKKLPKSLLKTEDQTIKLLKSIKHVR